MKKIRLFCTGLFCCGGLLGAATLLQSGCQSQDASIVRSPASPGMFVQDNGVETKGAAQMWAENCIRCHNSRSPTSYSDTHWDITMMHMRIQANLTVEEYRSIRDFLQASN